MKSMFIELVQANSALFAAIIALLISLRANWIAHKAYQLNVEAKAAQDRRAFSEKHRELLNELDIQYAKLATLALTTSRKILLFQENPKLHDMYADEFMRLKSNLSAVEQLRGNYEGRRKVAEQLHNTATDAAEIDDMLAKVRQLTIHVDKDIRHEEADLEILNSKVAKLNAA